MNSIKIIVTGSNGQLGSELKSLASLYPQYGFIFFTKEDFPINNKTVAQSIFELHRPQYFINCAAYTAVDKAESEQDLALEINGTAVGHLALLCQAYNTKFIHISTDYVFNGNQQAPLKETDDVDPVNAYGSSKLNGEYEAQKNNPDAIIIRTSWVYSSYGKNFVKTMMRMMNEKENISVVGDQYGSPTYAADLAEAIMEIIESRKWVPGIFNYSNDGIITWFDFATEIKSRITSSCIVNQITTEQFPTPAKRPKYSVMDKTKIQSLYPIQLKDWKHSLQICINRIMANTTS